MSINDFRDIPLLVRIPPNSIAYYSFFDRALGEYRYVFFDSDKLLICYQLLRFRYFDFETIENISFIIHGTNLRRWFKSIIGTSYFPISSTKPMKDKRINILFFNKKFTSWLIETIESFEEFHVLFNITEGKNSIHSFKALGYTGGKPIRVNEHDYTLRKLISRIIRELGRSKSFVPEDRKNIQVSFPVVRNNMYVVPDATIFLGSNSYHLEFDNNTEPHSRILSKLLRYSEDRGYHNSVLFFVFNTRNRVRNNVLSKRISTFLNYTESVKHENGETIFDVLNKNGIHVIGLPLSNAGQQVSKNIINFELGIEKPSITVSDLSGGIGLIENMLSIHPVVEEGIDYFLEYEDELFSISVLPLVYVRYGFVGEENRVRTIIENLSSTYTEIGILLDGSITDQHHQFSYSDLQTRLIFLHTKVID